MQFVGSTAEVAEAFAGLPCPCQLQQDSSSWGTCEPQPFLPGILLLKDLLLAEPTHTAQNSTAGQAVAHNGDKHRGRNARQMHTGALSAPTNSPLASSQ